MQIDWPPVVATVLGSGVVAAAVTQGVAAVRDHTQRRRDGRMVALFAALSLERFGGLCADFVADTANYHYSKGAVGKLHRTVPAMQPLRSSVDLGALPLHIASRLLEFEVSMEQANVDLEDRFADDHFALAMPIFLRLGEAAFEGARVVRMRMRLPRLKSADLDRSLQFLSEQRQFLKVE